MKMFKSIKVKLWICVGIVFLGMTVSSLYTMHFNLRLREDLQTLQQVDFPIAMFGGDLLSAFEKQTKLYEDAVMLGEEGGIEEADKLTGEIASTLDRIGKISAGRGGDASADLREKFVAYAALASTNYRKLAGGGEAVDMQDTLKKISGMREEIHLAMKSRAENSVSAVEKKIEKNVKSAQGHSRLIGIFLASVLLICAVAIHFVTRRLLIAPLQKIQELARTLAQGRFDSARKLGFRPGDEIANVAGDLDTMLVNLQEASRLASRIAQGDLQVHVTLASENDQLGLALKRMVENLNSSLEEVRLAGDQIASGSAQVADASQCLSQGATEQASSMEEITSSMTQMTAQIRKNSENAISADKMAALARETAERGNQQMREMVTAVEEINRAGQSISNIIKVIDEIAFQTNLLALNAAVEAARAGQYGKGFAVVAEEVRNLAARSAKAAKETAELIENSVRKGESGVEIAHRTAASLGEIVGSITRVTDLAGEIAAASNEQSRGIGEINLGLAQISQVTQQNTASAEESAAAANELSAQSERLRQMLQRFRLRNGGAVGSLPYAGAVAAY